MVHSDAFGLALKIQNHAVAQAGGQDVADIGEGDVVAAFAQGENFGRKDDGLGAAGRGAEADVFAGDFRGLRAGVRGQDEAADVVADVAGDGDGADELLHVLDGRGRRGFFGAWA